MNISGDVIIMRGVAIVVCDNAELTLRNHCTIGDRAEIICKKRIEVGEYSEITWDCQVTDFASHPIEDLLSGKIHNLFREVIIGNHCWIGNRTTIQPGTVLPDWTIVASNSILNKDYKLKAIPSYSLIGGIPAKLLRENVRRDYENDAVIYKFFKCNNNEWTSKTDII